MEDPMKDAWNEVADGFADLGRTMKERYQGDERPSPGAEANAAGEALRDAFERFVNAGRDVGLRAVDVLRDDDVKAQAKHAATSLNDALSATVDLIGREVGSLFRRPDAPIDVPVEPEVEAAAAIAAEPDAAVDGQDDTAPADGGPAPS
jgi:hypothetical protein